MHAGRYRNIARCSLSINHTQPLVRFVAREVFLKAPLQMVLVGSLYGSLGKFKMSDAVKHECAVALLRLRKPLAYYKEKYGSDNYGAQKMILLLEKQHNRGQDGAGIASIHLNAQPGFPCYQLEKSAGAKPLTEIVSRVLSKQDAAEVYLGHLRYATFGQGDVSACHPFVRESTFLNRTVLLAGNFNLTNAHEIFETLVASGHHPASKADGYLILQLLAHYLERGDVAHLVEVLRQTTERFDGAFTLCGMLGDGHAFALRDAHAIRPGYYYCDDEVIVVASERPAIQAAFNCMPDQVQELPPGQALVIDPAGAYRFLPCLPPQTRRSCVFERIYFSRANDADIHQERKRLGGALAPQIMERVDHDLAHTFFSYIPNTAQISFHGLVQTLMKQGEVRFGQIAVKDAKFRTFIADAASRADFFMHVYDVTYGLLTPGVDSLVVLDDSIVRGNTMRNALLPILDRLQPKKIVIASSAPPIKYPDCYGIDMATLHELLAFEAAVDVLRERNALSIFEECYARAKRCVSDKTSPQENCVKPIYEAVGDEALLAAITRRLCPENIQAKVEVVYQQCDDLRKCCPNHTGDWYFTGDYPTPGGFRVVNQALINYHEHNSERAYN